MEGAATEATSAKAQQATPNILSTLHTLLLSSPPSSSAFAHPYAPATNYGSWKGKAREGSIAVGLEDQHKLLDQLRDSVRTATAAVGKAIREEGKVKLGRAMKDVVTNQATSLSQLPSLCPDLSPPSFRQPVAPIQLLEAIAQRLGIETYLEESQFGLLKTTLAIAGKRFVLDVDLEVDSATGVEEDEAGPSINADPRRGKVRLAKLLVNHVTKDGGTASSDSIGQAIQGVLDDYLTYWNGVRDQEEGERIIKRLWEELGDLAGLDALAENGRDCFAEIEAMSSKVKGLEDGLSSVLPSFNLAGEIFRIRPAAGGENVADPFASEQGRCDWILEYVPRRLSGLVVRRNWLSEIEDAGVGVTVEQLLYDQEFPYSGVFTHNSKNGLDQHWSMVHSGPAGYMVGRCGVRDDTESLLRLLKALRRQANMNDMITSVLGGKLQTQDGEEEEVDLDILAQAPTILPITLTLDQSSLYALMPLPHSTEAMAPSLNLSFQPTESGLDISWTLEPVSEIMSERIQDAVNRGKTVGMDVVKAVAEIERALGES